jgi:hypothetical protein
LLLLVGVVVVALAVAKWPGKDAYFICHTPECLNDPAK